ncbi:YkgG family uncharacterized protein [Lutibacter sp. Hel_I_33_5]|uniref:LUD domain-containing protein n=1 Tax=Lutibacter sp. Hel_I_33_5 TaxID=1566289 RepID=UPI0011A05558|nr:LUD domain-containing protein [Lutibacter sp. Hel_I_33_5]TVZ57094.1 YkgG family uncharacterized protein [Lutibacter sp. Hel_I_33_5]
MSFFKKLFKVVTTTKDQEIKQQEVNLSLDDAFVHYFIKKGGKFLYCTKKNEIAESLKKIIKENNWNTLSVIDQDLIKLAKKTNIALVEEFSTTDPFFTTCEHLIADNGDILFSSNQIKSKKLSELSDNFIVYAKTSQLVKDTGQGLTGIKTNCKENIPTNISAVKKYAINKNDDNFLNYGNSNSKNLYLLLFEDL